MPTALVREPRTGPPKLLLYTRFNEFSLERGADAIDRVLACLPAAKLSVVGDGPQRPAFERLLLARSCAARVRFAGFLHGHELGVALREADVGLWLFDDTPINRARSPVKLLELLAVGTPVVAEAVGEVAALGGAGLQPVTPGNVPELTAAVRHRALGKAGQEAPATRAGQCLPETLTWESRAARLERRYAPCT
jgi:glycosyltransferase involved in cell wall biosynthesis